MPRARHERQRVADGAIGRPALTWTTLDEQLARRATLEGEAKLYEELFRERYQNSRAWTRGSRAFVTVCNPFDSSQPTRGPSSSPAARGAAVLRGGLHRNGLKGL